jgi:hypothetical protein
MRIENWQVTLGERTIDLLLLKYFFAAGMIFVLAIVFNRLSRYGWLKDVGDILAVLAILFAVIQFVDARLQKHEMNTIAKSMSTRFVGLFPKNLLEITEVLGKGTKYVYIMADFVDYGAYSFPLAFKAYLEKLKEARLQGATVRIICYDQQLSDQELAEQFSDQDFLQERTSRRFQNYFAINSGVPVPSSAGELRKLLADAQRSYILELSKLGVEFSYFPERAEFFLWLEDDEEAVFAFKSQGRKQREFSFRTQDTNLISQFRQIFDRRWRTSSKAHGASAGSEAKAATTR